jgi:hypothetical protein
MPVMALSVASDVLAKPQAERGFSGGESAPRPERAGVQWTLSPFRGDLGAAIRPRFGAARGHLPGEVIGERPYAGTTVPASSGMGGSPYGATVDPESCGGGAP